MCELLFLVTIVGIELGVMRINPVFGIFLGVTVIPALVLAWLRRMSGIRTHRLKSVAKCFSGAIFVAFPISAFLLMTALSGGTQALRSGVVLSISAIIAFFGCGIAVVHYWYTMMFLNPFDEGFAGIRWYMIQRRRRRRRDRRMKDTPFASDGGIGGPAIEKCVSAFE